MIRRPLPLAIGVLLLVQPACLEATGLCWLDAHCASGICNRQTHQCIGGSGDGDGGSGAADMSSACSWPAAAQLLAIDYSQVQPPTHALLGASLAATPSRLFVGAPMYKSGQLTTGAIYVLNTSGAPKAQAQLLPPQTVGNEYLGATLAAVGDTLLAGPEVSQGATEAVYLFSYSGSSWSGKTVPSPNSAVPMAFGGALAYDGGSLAYVGAKTAANAATGATVGAVYGLDVQAAMLTGIIHEGQANNGGFGQTLVLSPDTLIVAAPSEGAGAFYSIPRTGFTGDLGMDVVPVAMNANDFVGSALAAAGDTLIVGPGQVSNDKHVYYYKWSSGSQSYFLQATINPPDTQGSFGSVVALLSPLVVAVADPDFANGGSTGAVYLYGLVGSDRTNSPQPMGKVLPAATATAAGAFGHSLAVSGTTLFIGASSTAMGDGAIYSLSCR